MIKIDMEMPENCEECKFRMCGYSTYCLIGGDISLNTVAEKDRHESCPLIDEGNKTCGNCGCSEKDYDNVLSCYYWDYEEGMSPNKVYMNDFCTNWEKE